MKNNFNIKLNEKKIFLPLNLLTLESPKKEKAKIPSKLLWGSFLVEL